VFERFNSSFAIDHRLLPQLLLYGVPFTFVGGSSDESI